MPRNPQDTVTWDELSPAERGAIIRAYGGPEYEAALAQGNGGAGITDEQLGNSPVLWPPVVEADGDLAPPGSEQIYVDTLRANGNQTMIAIDNGTWESGPNGQTLAYGDPTNGQGNPYGGGSATADGSYNFHTYDPSRGLTDFNFEAYTGVNPGVTIDTSKYLADEQMLQDQQLVRDMADYYRELDPNRWAIDPNDVGQVDTYTYDPATADIYTTNIDGVFDPTRQQLDYANQLNDYAAQLDGSHLGNAAELQYLAATGQTPLIADMRLAGDAGRMEAQQLSMAARARGSSGAGLALMNAQNNAQLGYLGLAQAADIARVDEMNRAREAYAQTGNAVRQGDLSAASQAAQIGQQLYGVNNAELAAGQANTQQLNAGSQYNTGVANEANVFNANASSAADQFNVNTVRDTLDKNRVAGMTAESGDRGLSQAYDTMALNENRGNQTMEVRGEEMYQGAVADISTILGNIYGDKANDRTTLEGISLQQQPQMVGAITSGIAGGLGALATMSDRRKKNIHGEVGPADFTKVKDYNWSYDETVSPQDDWLNGGSTNSGMAQDFPKDLVTKDEEGNLRVDAMKAILRYAGSIGDVQRRLEQLEKR